ncbi:hypothetical protein NC651_024299 [Populus alba x Populus x berolinensis]|nr:hypothetical protein NC651_024299 [Populus alba x Populus x berolinensis]
MEGDDDRIEESSVRLVGSSNDGIVDGGGGIGESRWVDGSEVDSESPPWSLLDENDSGPGYGSMRRRLVKKPKRVDSFDVEAMEIAGAHHYHSKDLSIWQNLALAFQTLGVVYGDLGTSPLYVFTDVFSKVPIRSEVDVLGALSLVIYTIALIPLAKYVFVVLKANDNGEGGTFALYSLICRYAKVNMLPNRQPADENISSYRLKLPTPELERALNIKETLEKRSSLKTVLLLLVLTGTSMVIGDGILTPAMSVMSAVSGLQGEISGFGTSAVVIVSIIILLGLFNIQRFGTGKVGFMFAPVLALWFFSLGAIGIYNLVKHDISVLKALNPAYIYFFFKKNSSAAWSALGGCVLCITGAEAMFADLGHFSVQSIQIAFTCVVFPCLLLAYMGQASYLMKYPDSASRIFYDSVPESLFWPVFVIATLAAMIASQAMISATFSCVKQAMALGCFPRLKIVHTSRKLMGQIYIPIINYFLMIMCIIVVSIFRSTTDIANAYVLNKWVIVETNITTCESFPLSPIMDLESGVFQNHVKKESWKTVLTLAYQSLGVVYGDLSTSPLYVYKSTFAEDIQHSETNEEIYGVLSFVFWTLTLVPLLKYVFIVLKADDNGEGGTFALYSLLCRHARINSLPNCQVADEELYEYKKDAANTCLTPTTTFGLRLKSTLEKHRVLQRFLLLLALIGTCMVIGDGVLTPALSDVEVPVACTILICLFALQHYGTHRVGFLFAPVVLMWLLCISAIGIYNIIHWNPHVYQALSPYYMYKFLRKTQRGGWMSLGGILLCITGSEAMFADLGHFSQLSIQIAFTSLVYPSLILAYMGQAAYLSQHHVIDNDYHIGFYVSVPGKLRWPVLVIAILAAVVGSQAIITGTFSIIKQCSALGCFPRVKIVHTSSKIHGQIYIPEINWTLMLLCLAVTIGFRDTKRLGNASGLAVITVMLVTTCLMSLVIVLCWHKTVFLAICFVCFFGTIEALYFSASLIKFLEGAWVPIALSFIFLIVMCVWHYGTLKAYEFDVQNKVSINWLLSLGPSLGIVRVRGIGLIHTELVSGIPAIFSHFVTNLPAFHQVLVFLCIKSVPVPHVRAKERFLIGHIGPREYRLYRCIVRYGYRDVHKDDMEFEKDLVCSIAEYIRTGNAEPNGARDEMESEDDKMTVVGTCCTHTDGIQLREDDVDKIESAGTSELREIRSPPVMQPRKRVRFIVPDSPKINRGAREELQELMEAREAGIAYILGHCYVRAKQGSSMLKKLVVNYGYEFLRRNSRAPAYTLSVPHASTLEVGMVYRV